MGGAAVAVIDGGERQCDMCRAAKARFAFAFAENADLGKEIKRLGWGRGHAASQNALFIRANHGSMLNRRRV